LIDQGDAMLDINISDALKLIDATPIGLALCRMDRTVVHANPAYASIVGYSPEEVTGH